MRLKGALTTALALVLLVTMLLLMTLPSVAQSGITNFTNVKASGDITAGDDLIATDDTTVGDDLTVAGDVVNTPTTAIVVTAGSTITPTGQYVPITGTTGVGTSSIAGPTAGRLIYVTNLANATITLTDTGTLKLAGNFALGQYDSITLRGDGTNWIEAARSNN